MKKMVKCDQIKCGYNICGGCRPCKTCSAKPHEINEDCDTCWNCHSDEGILRWDNEKPYNELKEIEVVIR